MNLVYLDTRARDLFFLLWFLSLSLLFGFPLVIDWEDAAAEQEARRSFVFYPRGPFAVEFKQERTRRRTVGMPSLRLVR